MKNMCVYFITILKEVAMATNIVDIAFVICYS